METKKVHKILGKSNFCSLFYLILIVGVFVASIESRRNNVFRRFRKKGTNDSQYSAVTSHPYNGQYQGHQDQFTRPTQNRQHPFIPSNRKQEKGYGEMTKNKPYGYGPSHHHEEKAVEKDDTLDGLTGVVGPLIFPIPFLLALLPFAIPALPIALSLPFGNATSSVAEGRESRLIDESEPQEFVIDWKSQLLNSTSAK